MAQQARAERITGEGKGQRSASPRTQSSSYPTPPTDQLTSLFTSRLLPSFLTATATPEIDEDDDDDDDTAAIDADAGSSDSDADGTPKRKKKMPILNVKKRKVHDWEVKQEKNAA